MNPLDVLLLQSLLFKSFALLALAMRSSCLPAYLADRCRGKLHVISNLTYKDPAARDELREARCGRLKTKSFAKDNVVACVSCSGFLAPELTL